MIFEAIEKVGEFLTSLPSVSSSFQSNLHITTASASQSTMSNSHSSSSYFYSSSSNTSDGEQSATGHRYSTTSHTDADGNTTVRTARQGLGQPAIVEQRHYDRTGQEHLEAPGPEGTSAGGVRRITDLDE